MAEIKKIATRESYGNALKELASLQYWTLTSQQQQKQEFSKKHIRTVILTAVLQSQI